MLRMLRISSHLKGRKEYAFRILSANNYHSFPDPDEKPIISTNKSNVQKTVDKSDLFLKEDFKINNKSPKVDGGLVGSKTITPITECTTLSNGLKVASQVNCHRLCNY